MGARIVLVARDKVRGEGTLARLREKGPGAPHSIHYADLSRLAGMKRVASEIAAAESRIDILINNAGAIFPRRIVTPDGLELTFATNHMSYFVLTHGLRERLVASAPSRVINTSSHAHRGNRLDFANLQFEKGYSAFRVYGVSKLCNILYTRELARHLAGQGVTAVSFHPGFVNTRFGAKADGLAAYVLRFLKLFALSPEQGAETLVYLATADLPPEANGAYFYKRRTSMPSKEALDDAAAALLWQETARLAGVDAP